MEEGRIWWILGICAALIAAACILFFTSADPLICEQVSVRGKDGIYCNVQCAAWEEWLPYNKLEFSWFPGITGCEETTSGLCSYVLCGFDLILCETFEFDPNSEYRKAVEAVEGEDYVITNTSVAVNLGTVGDLGFSEQGWNISDIDWDKVLEAYLTGGEDVTIRYTVQYTALKELSSAELIANISYSDYYFNQTEKNQVEKYDGNYPDRFDYKKNLNIQPGEHVIFIDIQVPIYAVKYLKIDSIDFSVMAYED